MLFVCARRMHYADAGDKEVGVESPQTRERTRIQRPMGDKVDLEAFPT